MLRTTDGGTNWMEQTDPRFSSTQSLFFLNAQSGWLGSTLRTSDGGVTWLDSPAGTPAMSKVWFTGTDHGWGIDGNVIYKTMDGGQSWSSHEAPQQMYLTDIIFVDVNHGLAVGLGGILRTDDGGNSWTMAYAETTPNFCLNAVSITYDGYGFAAGDYGDVLFTNDFGANWFQRSQNAALNAGFSSVSFAARDTGWAVGGQAGHSFILKGMRGNGSFNWYPQTTPWMAGFSDVAAIDAQTAYAVGGSGAIFVTTDGNTWLPQYSGTNLDLTKVCFVDRDHGFVLSPSGQEGGTGRLLKTSNGGTNWISLPFAAPEQTMDMKFADAENGWMVGCFSDEGCGYGFILHTSDGGISWTQQFSSQDTALWACDFVSATTGWAVGYPGLILKTTDGGLTWIPQQSGVSGYLTIVDFVDALHGFVQIGGGYYLHTDDGGETWQQRTMPGAQNVSDFMFTDASSGWAVGWDGSILHYEDAAADIAHATPAVPHHLSLSAYPNPFNPNTVLSFDVPASSRVQLAVYDITGRLVKTLADRVYSEGSYRVEFNGANLPSGIYFARMSGKDLSKTQKLVLLK